MSLALAAVVPHSPLLVERVGGERTATLELTLQALSQLAAEIAQSRVETIVAIGDHGDLRPDRLTLCQPAQMKLQLRKFGDVATERTWHQDVAFGYRVREYGETNLPLATVAPAELGYAVGVPLMLLTQHVPQVRVAAFGPALLPAEDHRGLGLALRHIAEQTAGRVAILAAGDIPEGSQQFAEAVKAAAAGDHSALATDSQWADTPQGLAWRSVVTLLGAAGETQLKPEVLAEQYAFDTGLLTLALRP